jgi:hypothetical protein
MKVPERLLKPNLLIALVRLRQQERERGPSSLNGDLFMERFMARPKRRVQQGIVRNIDQTYLTSMEMISRALRPAIVHRGCISSVGELDEDPEANLQPPRLLHAGKAISKLATTSMHAGCHW